MVRVLRGIVFVVLVLGPAGRLRAQGAPSGSPFDYALFGLTQTRLGPGVEVFSGDIGANVGTVTIGAGARVARRLFCLFLDGTTSTQCRAAVTVPLVAPAALPPVTAAPGRIAVRVAAGRIAGPLGPGAYGRVHLGGHAGLLLTGGTYALRALRLGRHAELVCAAACRIAVLDPVRLG